MKFIPKYITTDILADYGEHLTHEAYNEMVLLNSTQGDYNTKVLNQLFNTDEGIQIPYLNNKIKKVTDDQATINEDMDQVVADMKALAGSLSKYSTILETRRMIQYATQDFIKTNKIKAGENIEVEVDALNNVTISATGGGSGDITQEYVDEHDASTLDAANNYTDNAIDNIDLDNYATKEYVDGAIADIPIPVVPTDISAFNNDVGYITGYTETDPVFSASAAADITSQDITDWNNKSDFSGDYEDLTNKPTIPTNTSDLNNDSGFISSESDPIFSASPAAGITAQDILNWNNSGGLVNLLDGNATGSLKGINALDDADPDYPTYAIGQNAVALGYGTRAEGAGSFAGGSGAWAESYNDFAFGSGAHASGGQSVAFGSGATASGSGSFAVGNGATASGSTSVSIGQGSTVAGSSSFGLGTSNTVNSNAFAGAAIGLSNTVSAGQGAMALGYGTTSSSYGSVAEGLQTTSSAYGSHAEGGYTTASGDYAHAEGQHTIASGTNAHAEGLYTEAGTMQHVEGYYNLVEQMPIIHMVGNGNSDTRSNAYTLDQLGNGWYAKDVYVGSTSGTHRDSGSVKLARETQLLPTITSGEFMFEGKPVGTYLVHNGSTNPQYDITYRGVMTFRASTATTTRVSVTAQWGLLYIIKPYDDADTNEIFAYVLFANGKPDGTMEFRLQSIKRISSGYRIQFSDMMITNNESPIRRLVRMYDSSSTYNVDDLVLNTDGWFYRCTTAITTPEEFDSSHWTSFYDYGIDKYIKELINQSSGGNLPLETGSSSTDPGIQMTNNTASSIHSVALGSGCRATQREAIALGYYTKASGSASFAAGDSTQALGNFASALGLNTIANERQSARGFYNISKNYSNTGVVDIVGNGTGTNARSNAYTLDNQGNGWFAKDVYVGSTSGKDKDAGSVKLLRENVIAPAYDAAVSYVVNQLVMYNGALYKCNTATSGEAWTPAHWTQTTLADLLSNI
jgi:hypothetical protein